MYLQIINAFSQEISWKEEENWCKCRRYSRVPWNQKYKMSEIFYIKRKKFFFYLCRLVREKTNKMLQNNQNKCTIFTQFMVLLLAKGKKYVTYSNWIIHKIVLFLHAPSLIWPHPIFPVWFMSLTLGSSQSMLNWC